MADGLEVHRDASEWVEVAIGSQGGKKNFHESLSLEFCSMVK
jgi:hypothetical protein